MLILVGACASSRELDALRLDAGLDAAGAEAGSAPGQTIADSGGAGGALCGNGRIEGDEQCDRQNLGGATCDALGEGTGVLTCDPRTCVFDVSMCHHPIGGSSGSGGYGG